MSDFKKEITEKENMQLVINGQTPAWLPSFFDAFVWSGFVRLGRLPIANGNTKDIFGVEFIMTADGQIPYNTVSRNFELTDIRKWRDIMPDIDLATINWEQEANSIRSTVKDGKMINFLAGYVWEQLHYMMGFEDALLALIEEPDATYECLDAIADFWIDALRRIYPYLKPELVMFMEHMATARGMLMSPEAYRSIIKPVHKKMYDAVIELGALPEIHVDGYIEDILPDLIEIGIKAIQPFQIFNDVNHYKEKHVILAVGGWDAFGRGNQADSTEEEIRASVRLAMDTYGPGGRYVFSENGVSPAFPHVGPVISDEARRYGLNFYRQ